MQAYFAMIETKGLLEITSTNFYTIIMRKIFLIAMTMIFSVSVMAQQRIQLRSADKAECVKSDMASLKASFSFSTVEAQDYETERGTFSWLSLANTVIGGNEGDPQIPVVNQLIAVPFGAQPRIEITSYSTTDYRLEDYGMHTLLPRQLPVRKDQRPEDLPFIMNEAAYQTRGLRSEPTASIDVVGTMRGIRLGKLGIEPVSYDPVNNKIRVFNDIEVTVHFDDADTQATEQMLVDTYSPYFNGIYDMLFNGRSIRSAYDDHPDLYTTPVKMLVVTTSTYTNSTAFQNWLNWKKQKGINVDVQTVTSSTSAANVRSLIQSRYNANHPTFLVIVGDETAVKYYTTWSNSSLNYSPYISDNPYASIDNDVYHDMFMSRMSVSNTTELGYLVNKILMYEKYTMPDPSYLNNVLLIAGADDTWAPRVGRPTINYAANNYFNTAHGFSNVYKYVSNNYNGCYNYLSSGVGFANYTAHGDIQEWYSPNFTNSNVNSLTNTNKYFWAMGNCCLTANWGNSSYYPCFGEAMIRAQNKGAFGYIGSIPESYWYEDYYFGVGATSVMSQTPSMSQTTTGVYDFMFDDTKMNTLNSVPFAGNVAVTYAHANNYTSSVSDEYYWRGYQCLGDGSVMPYHTQPAANSVSHASQLLIGATSFTVNAVAGSYVAITVNNEIIGVAEVPSNGTIDVPITAQTSTGAAMIVVTRNQRQPYITTIPIQGGIQYTILATANPETGGTVSGAGQYYESNQCTLVATANAPQYEFTNWMKGDDVVSTNATYTFTVTGDGSYTANFTALTPHSITCSQTANGTISADKTSAYKNETVTLTATPASGYMFNSWVVYKTGDLNTTISVSGNTFTMPNYDVTVVGLFTALQSNEVTIGSGTSTTNGQYLPTSDYYNYSTTQQIYTADELGSAGTIVAISFYYSNTTSSSARSLDIYMSHTSNATISSWSTVSSDDLVFSGNYAFSQGWNTIVLNTPFVYNGTNNILLTVDDNTNNYSTDSKFYTYSTGANRAIRLRSNNYNQTPMAPQTGTNYNGTQVKYNAQLKVTKGVASTDGCLSASPSSLTGFNTEAGTASNPQSVVVFGSDLQSNVIVTAPMGYEVCATQNGTYNSTMTLTPSSGSVRQTLYVRLASDVNAGDYNGDMTFTSGTASTTVSLSGTVTPGAILYTIIATANPTEGGTVTGAGTYPEDGSCTLTATANVGYTFTNWTKNGSEVSTNATYSFTVTEASEGEYFANFTLNSYDITATANPAEGGTITGTGTFNHGEEINLTATANEGYTFTNWTMNGNVVSTEATYNFTVTEAVALVANFTLNSYVVTVTANPVGYGSVSVGIGRSREELVYDFEDGTSQGWTLLKGTTGDSPNNWMHVTEYTQRPAYATSHYGHDSSDGWMLSESYISGSSSSSGSAVTPDNYLVSPQIRLGGSITFYVTDGNDSYGAEHFAVAVSTTNNTSVNSFMTVQEWTLLSKENGTRSFTNGTWYEYTVDLSSYSGMGYIAIRHFDCNDQWILGLDDITIVEGEDSTISNDSGTFYYGESCTVTATPSTGYYFLNWTENGTVVSTSDSYTFTVTSDRDLVANFSDEMPLQIVTLASGWNWWSTNLDITLDQLKDALAAAVGTNGTAIIKSQGGTITCQNGQWRPANLDFDIKSMYQIYVNTNCEITLSGTQVNPSEYEITIYNGINWIGFLPNESMTLNEAFGSFPVEGDMVKSEGNSATYTGGVWRPAFDLEPGKGYIYQSNAQGNRTFIYGTNNK